MKVDQYMSAFLCAAFILTTLTRCLYTLRSASSIKTKTIYISLWCTATAVGIIMLAVSIMPIYKSYTIIRLWAFPIAIAGTILLIGYYQEPKQVLQFKKPNSLLFLTAIAAGIVLLQAIKLLE